MWWFDTEGRRAHLLTAAKEANALVNYNTEHKYFILWATICAMHIQGVQKCIYNEVGTALPPSQRELQTFPAVQV